MVLESARGGYRPLGVNGGNFLSGPRLVKILTIISCALLVIFVASYFLSDDALLSRDPLSDGIVDDTDIIIIPHNDHLEAETAHTGTQAQTVTQTFQKSPKVPPTPLMEDDLESTDVVYDDVTDHPNEDILEPNISEGDDADTTPLSLEETEPLVCTLPLSLDIPKPEDGSYAPPPVHSSVLEVMPLLSVDEQQAYCTHWRQVLKAKPNDQYDYNRDGKCGTWQDEYIRLHKQNLQQFQKMKEGDLELGPDSDPAKFAVYMCVDVAKNGHRGCGGLADRMSGMISTFFFSLITSRAYFAYWSPTNPFPLERLFEQPFIDWRYDDAAFATVFDDKTTQTTRREVKTLNAKWEAMDEVYFKDGPETKWDTMWEESLLQVISNRAIIIHTFDRSAIYPPKLNAMGLFAENTFGCLTDFLFRPTVGSRQYIEAYKKVLEFESVFSVGIQIRTGDNQIVNPQDDNLTIETYSYFLTCANQIAATYAKPHHKRVVYFFITDSLKLRDEVASLNNDANRAAQFLGPTTSVLVTGLPIGHVETTQVAKYINITIPLNKTEDDALHDVASAVIENWLLSYTDYRVISKQGYGKLASFHSNKDGTTYMMPRLDSQESVPDCSLPGTDISYQGLSHLWSLG